MDPKELDLHQESPHVRTTCCEGHISNVQNVRVLDQVTLGQKKLTSSFVLDYAAVLILLSSGGIFNGLQPRPPRDIT